MGRPSRENDVLSRRADPHALLKIAALLPRRPHLHADERVSSVRQLTRPHVAELRMLRRRMLMSQPAYR